MYMLYLYTQTKKKKLKKSLHGRFYLCLFHIQEHEYPER